AKVDVGAALAWRDFMVSDYHDDGQVQWLDGKGIALVRGTGRLAGPGKVDVDGRLFSADHVVLAPGSDPALPPIPGLEGLEGLWGTREATGMKEVPGTLVVLGAGPAGVELAQATHRLGAQVVLVEASERVLPREPAPAGEALTAALQRDGMEVLCSAEVVSAGREGDDFVLTLADGSTARGERLLVATGRRPRVEGLGLETVGARADKHGIKVDERLNAAEGVWAIGDAVGIWPLTYVGEYQGEVVATNILGTERAAHYEAVPRVTYTDPQVAAVGVASDRFDATVPISGISRMATYTHAYRESNGFLTVLSDGERVTGAYAVGPEAGEWLQQLTLAVRARVPLDVLVDTIQPFPAFSEIVGITVRKLVRAMSNAG
ncbi:MAG TPA: NAD(P)/FAD-dependent oxidoreductase, partial [Acidimicrobiales bacterium]|nr:NAD(P)/FAD-dependent oxidoreductase [Acidimicrobiales bacterium]